MKQLNARIRNNLFRGCLFVLLLSGPAAMAQSRTVTGTVVDNLSQPLSGVMVNVSGTTTGVFTDGDGKFTLSVAPDAVLNFSFYGMNTQEIAVGTQTVIDVTMSEDVHQLDDVVAIGYGSVRRRDLTGSVVSVGEDVILAVPDGNVMTALQGRITGLDISGSGSNQSLIMRGRRSLDVTMPGDIRVGGSNAPIFIIDGVMSDNYNDISPADIASIDVLKDAASTAIYGARGANGVIIVTTKSPDKGKLSVSYNAYVGWTMRADENPRRHGESWIAPRRIAGRNDGTWFGEENDGSLPGLTTVGQLEAFRRNEWTDYRELTSRIPLFTNHTLSFTGGTESTNARFTVGWEETNTQTKGGKTDNFNLRTVVNQKISNWLSAGVNVRLAHNFTKNSPYENTGGWALGTPYDKEGNLKKYPIEGVTTINPLWNASDPNYKVGKDYGTRVSATGFVDIKPVDGLTFTSQINTNLSLTVDGDYTDGMSEEQIDGQQQSTATYEMRPGRSIEWNNIATYQKTFGDHTASATVFTAWQKNMSERLKGTGTDQLIGSNWWYALGSAATQNVASGYTQSQMFSYAGRFNYSYKGKYLLSASFRQDGASRLSKGRKWDYFPAASAAWRVSDEPFMQNLGWVDNLKLRLSYGVTGNSGIAEYGTQSSVNPSNTGLALQDNGLIHYDYGRYIGNLETGWEKSVNINLGVDFSIFQGRLDGTVEVYNTNTKDLLLARNLPSTAGADGSFTIFQNIGKTNNKGIEVALNGYPVRNSNFSWKTSLTFSRNVEKIVSLVTEEDVRFHTGEAEEGWLLIGHPIRSYKDYAYRGIWTEAERAEAATYFKNSNKTDPFVPGDYKILDRNDDHIINEDNDYGYIGSTTPDWFAGLDNNFRYKNFDLNVYFFFRWGHWGSNPASSVDPATGGGSTLFDQWFYHKDTNNGSGAKLPPLSSKQYYDYHGYQAMFYADRSFFKVKNISLGYSLPQSVLTKLSMQKCRVYVSSANPLYFAKSFWLKGIDPEGSRRNYIFGVELTF